MREEGARGARGVTAALCASVLIALLLVAPILHYSPSVMIQWVTMPQFGQET